ncbi:MAG: type IV toxin-antitoxin system AbiEi family antitoxin domain-containing protein [Verrucomicrobiae bacterium]|nr:type IV toxin-antitoxin system AbiEi family antitoxin domain-containing protein [Verrucomicrobiae bacterium]
MENIVFKRKNRFGGLEIRLLSYVQMRRKGVVRCGELRTTLGLAPAQERQLFSRLARAGTIVRLKREFYLFPPTMPVNGLLCPDSGLVLKELMKVCGNGQYQLCGMEAFRCYGFTDQVPNRVDIYNNRLCGDRVIGNLQYRFIKVSDGRLGGTQKMSMDGSNDIIMPTMARALVDAVYDWSRFGTLPAAYQWIRDSVAKNRRLADVLADVACRYGNRGTIRRLGFVLNSLALRGEWKKRLQRQLRSESVIPLVPGRKACGTVNVEWGVIVNE